MSIVERLNSPEKQRPATLPAMLKQYAPRLVSISPDEVNINKFSAALMAEVRGNKRLTECDPMSIMGAFVKATQLGLEPGAQLGMAYFVPFKGACQLIIGYRGMMELAYRSGKVKSIAARVIHQNDEFDYSFGLEDRLHHKPATGDRGPMIGVYAIAQLVGGGAHFEVLSKDDIEKSRKASKSGTSGPWRDHFDEMAKKTAIRKLFKYLPVGVELNRAISIDERSAAAQDNKETAQAVLDGDFEIIGGGDD